MTVGRLPPRAGAAGTIVPGAAAELVDTLPRLTGGHAAPAAEAAGRGSGNLATETQRPGAAVGDGNRFVAAPPPSASLHRQGPVGAQGIGPLMAAAVNPATTIVDGMIAETDTPTHPPRSTDLQKIREGYARQQPLSPSVSYVIKLLIEDRIVSLEDVAILGRTELRKKIELYLKERGSHPALIPNMAANILHFFEYLLEIKGLKFLTLKESKEFRQRALAKIASNILIYDFIVNCSFPNETTEPSHALLKALTPDQREQVLELVTNNSTEYTRIATRLKNQEAVVTFGDLMQRTKPLGTGFGGNKRYNLIKELMEILGLEFKVPNENEPKRKKK